MDMDYGMTRVHRLSTKVIEKILEMDDLEDYKPADLVTAIGLLTTNMILLLTKDKAVQIKLAEGFAKALTESVRKVN